MSAAPNKRHQAKKLSQKLRVEIQHYSRLSAPEFYILLQQDPILESRLGLRRQLAYAF